MKTQCANCTNLPRPLKLSDPFHIHRVTRPGRVQSQRKQLVSTKDLLGARHFTGIISINPGKRMANVDIFTIFQMMKLRLRRGHPSSRWQSWDLNPRKCHQPRRTHLQSSLSSSLNTRLWSHSLLTSSGSESLNSQPSPVQLIKDWQDLSVSNSRRNCHSWIGPLPGDTSHRESLHQTLHTLSN